MKYLILEDDENKIRQLAEFVSENFKGAMHDACRSYNSGLRRIVETIYDFILLDMSMPTFDVSHKEPGGRFRAYGGKDILVEMSRKGLSTRAIVVTGFDSFGEGDNKISLGELNAQLFERFPDIYLGAVYYNAAENNWKDNLKRIINSIQSGADNAKNPNCR